MSSNIPKKLYQSWKTKNLPTEMRTIVDQIRRNNPQYDYSLYDDQDCRQFLLTHFGLNYAQAFDALIPGAFKCDFWRYAMLYIHGGVYMDIDMVPLLPLDEIIRPGDEFVSIVDKPDKSYIQCGIFQSFIACRPKHPILAYALSLAFVNIVTRRTELLEPLAVTGPYVMGQAINLYWQKKNPYERIRPGKYSQGLRLLKFDPNGTTVDETGQKLFRNKIAEYKPQSNYALTAITSPFANDPRQGFRRFRHHFVIIITIAMVLFFLLGLIFYRRWHRCAQSCSIRPSDSFAGSGAIFS